MSSHRAPGNPFRGDNILHLWTLFIRFGESGERIRSARVRTARSARSTFSLSILLDKNTLCRSRPVSASSSLAGEMGDVPPDGPVDIDALEVGQVFLSI